MKWARAMLVMAFTVSACRDSDAARRARPKPRKKAAAPGWQPQEGRDLVGKPAPAWAGGKTWINSAPLRLADLRGKVVLIRFWLFGCSYCSSTAPALNELHRKYRERGLVVIGFHHPKSRAHHSVERVRRATRDYGFKFPVAMDSDWEALRKYWFSGGERRRFTSVSFLIDKKGVIRWLHDGGEFHRGGGDSHTACRAAYDSVDAEIRALLEER